MKLFVRWARCFVMAACLVIPCMKADIDMQKLEKHIAELGGSKTHIWQDVSEDRDGCCSPLDGLVMNNVAIVKEGSDFYFECTISKTAWEKQREKIYQQLYVVKDRKSFAKKLKFLIPLVAGMAGMYSYLNKGAFMAKLAAWKVRSAESITLTRSEYRTDLLSFFILGTAVLVEVALIGSMISDSCRSNARTFTPSYGYTDNAVILKYLSDVAAESSRIIGFRKVDECNEAIHIRTDFPVNAMLS